MGAKSAAENEKWRDQHGIRLIVNVAAEVELHVLEEGVEVKQFPLRHDTEPAVVKQVFNDVYALVAGYMDTGEGILIHCNSGVNR